MNYINIKTKDRTVKAGAIKGVEVSVAFRLYSDVYQIADSEYELSLSETPKFTTVFEENQRDAWVAFNKSMFVATPAGE